jgi:hypothetical protein
MKIRIEKINLAALAFIGIAVAMVSSASAVETTWAGSVGDGLWATGGNWNTGVMPVAADTAILTNGGTISLGGVSRSITDIGTSTSGMVGNINNGTLAVSGYLYGDSGTIGAAVNGKVTKIGSGTLVLTNGNSSTLSATAVNSGILEVRFSTAKSGNAATVASGAQLAITADYGTSARTWNSAPITGAGSVVWNGTVRSNALNTYTGSTTVTTGSKLTLGSGSLPGKIADASPLFLDGGMLSLNTAAGVATYGGTTSGTGVYEKIGVNALTVTGQFAHTGLTKFCGPVTLDTGSSMLFDINSDTDFTKVALAVVAANTPADLTLNGALKFDVTSFTAGTGSWNVFDTSLSATNVVDYFMSGLTLIDGASTLAFNPVSTTFWECVDGERKFTFTEGVAVGDAGVLSVTSVLAGDANEDGTVNVADLTALLNNYNKTEMAWANGDFNSDGAVNVADLTALLNNYNKTYVPGMVAGTAVPEPSSLAMLTGIAAMGLLYWRRKRG